MNNTIYVCTEGSYSNYHICGIFDDKELAEIFCEKFCDHAVIEEWKLNPYESELYDDYSPYFVVMSKDGNVIKINNTILYNSDSENIPYINFYNNMCINVIAKTKEHAIKIANEHRIQLIALNKWEI